MQRPNSQQLLKWTWILGLAAWLSVMSLLLWRLPNAHSFAQASFYSTRLMYTSLFGVFWGVAPAVLRAGLAKTRASQL